MGVNIEIKAKDPDRERTTDLVKKICLDTMYPIVLEQKDVFFESRDGRLKIRNVNDKYQLIWYSRGDQSGPKQSDYIIAEFRDYQPMVDILSKTNGILCVVKKTRHLYIVGQTRIHLDKVDDIGYCIELEVVLNPGQSAEEGHRIAKDIMEKLEIKEENLITNAYADILREKRNTKDTLEYTL